jgi:hypothetical protein
MCSRRNSILSRRLRINFYNSVVASLVGCANSSGWRSMRSDVSRLKRDLLCSESHPNPLNPLNAKEKGVSELLLGNSTVCSFDSESRESLVLPYSDADFLEVSNQYGRFRHLFLQISTFGDSGIAAFVHPYILSPFGSDDSQLGVP